MNPSSGPGAFGSYRVLHQVGVGVLGPVFRAYNPSDDRPFSVKELQIDATPEQARLLVDALERLVDAQGFHPAVVMPVAVGIEEGTPFLVQEYIAAPSLDVAARRGAGEESQRTLALLDALAEGLDAAHGRGLLHGALHPRDLYVDGDQPRVTGFGVVPALEEAGLRAPLRRPYTAPEIVAGRPRGPEADRFAFAALAYELIVGRRLAGAGAQIGAELPLAVGEADAEALRAVFAAALAAAPERRPRGAVRFMTGLRAALETPAERRAASPAAAPAGPPAQREETAGQAAAGDAIESAPGGGISIRAAPRPAAPAAPAVPRRTASEASPEAPSLPARPARRAEWPWWSPIAMATATGLLIVAITAAYVAGLRLGGSMHAPAEAPEAVSEPPVAEAFPAPRPVPPAAAPPASPTPPVVTEIPETRAIPEAVESSGPPSAAAPPAEEGSGWVLVRTTPPGAAVTMAGAERGVTPLSVGDLAFGSHAVEVRRTGFQPATREVALSPSSPVVAVDITLDPLAAAAAAPPAADPGSLRVESRPPGARVFVGGRSAGTTPAVVSGLAAGPHEVRIELEGYAPWVTSVDVGAANEVRVAASLDTEGER